MDTALVTGLEAFVSVPRLKRYRDASTSDLDVAVLYCWNMRLAEALLPTIALFELSLRNVVHETLTMHVGSEWWFKAALTSQRYENILGVVSGILKKQGYPPSVGKVISEITFGFWPRLFAHASNPLWWSPPDPLIAKILPHHPSIGRDTRKKLEERLEYFVELRNRAVHHEAIFQGVAALNRPVLPVDEVHRQLVETIGWISKDAERIARRLDHFDDAFRVGRSAIEQEIKGEFNVS